MNSELNKIIDTQKKEIEMLKNDIKELKKENEMLKNRKKNDSKTKYPNDFNTHLDIIASTNCV